ncbi:MAG: D-aminoacyl-tRNA deacylase [Thermoplasmataceae archaeon]
MNLIIASREDPASMEMFRHILQRYPFRETAKDLYVFNSFLMEVIQEKHLFFDKSKVLSDSQWNEVEGVIFLSKHSSQAKIKSLTVHPTGNFGKAELGGLPGELSISYPSLMTAVFRKLAVSDPGDGINVTFEATHHGPLLLKPNFFLEIGTTPAEWENEDILEIVCSSLMDANQSKAKNFIGIGGGHYMPKITQYIGQSDINIGHMISKHAAESLDEKMLSQAMERTPEFSGILADWKGINSRIRDLVRTVSDSTGTELIKI